MPRRRPELTDGANNNKDAGIETVAGIGWRADADEDAATAYAPIGEMAGLR